MRSYQKFCLIISLVLISTSLFGQDEYEPQEIEIKSIFFGGGSFYIDDEQVLEITEFLNLHPNIEQFNITIHSHTDNIGGLEYNQWLSRMRSESVLIQLIQNNIPLEHIKVADFGEQSPVFDNQSWEGRLKNRRVDIILEPITL